MSTTPSHKPLARRSAVLALGAFALWLAFGVFLWGYAWQLAQRQQEAAREVQHTHQVLDQLVRLRETVASIGRELRDYIITGSELDQRQYGDAVRRAAGDMDGLRALLAANAAQAARVEALNDALAVRLATLAAIMEARRAGGPGAANANFMADLSSREARPVSHAIENIERQEREELLQRDAEEHAAIQRFRWVISCLVLAITLVFGLLFWLLHRRAAVDARLHLSEERFRLMADNARDNGIFMLDVNGIVTSWNPGAQRLKGYEAGEIVGRHFSVFYPQEDVEDGKPARELREAMASGQVRDEGWRMRKDGSRFWAEVTIMALRDEDGVVRGFAKLTRDMTPHRELEEALRGDLATSEARFQGIFDTAMDGIVTVDGDGRVVLFNAAAQAIFGWTREEAMGAPLESFIPQRFRAGHGALVRGFGTDNAAPRRMGAQRIVTGLRRDGTEFPIDASISQTHAGGQQLFTVILRDVTERVRAEQALRASEDALRRLFAAQDKVQDAERQRISRELHDDLQQKLTAIRIDVAALRAQQPALEKALGDVDAMATEAIASTRRIVSDLRPQVLEDLGLVAALEMLVEQFARVAGVACRLDASQAVGDALSATPAAEVCLYRVAQEALNNVLKHAHAHSVRITLAPGGAGEAVLRIEDDGTGFDAQGPHKPDSTGLIGMRERVRAFGGTLHIHPAAGGGTVVKARIPPGSEAQA